MPTASGRRSWAVYGEKLPKTRLARIYCYGNTLYIVNLIAWARDVCVVHCLRRMLPMPLLPGSNLGGVCLLLLLFFIYLFFNFLKGLCHGFLPKYIIFVSQEKLDKE